MKAEPNTFVAIDYTLSLDSGEVIFKTEDDKPLEFIMGQGQILPGLEKAVEGLEPGESVKVTLEPEDAYGYPKQELFKEIPKENFPQDAEIKPGMCFEIRTLQGPMMFRVHEVYDEIVVADFNHPLAGKRLHFDITVKEVRELNANELPFLLETKRPDQQED